MILKTSFYCTLAFCISGHLLAMEETINLLPSNYSDLCEDVESEDETDISDKSLVNTENESYVNTDSCFGNANMFKENKGKNDSEISLDFLEYKPNNKSSSIIEKNKIKEAYDPKIAQQSFNKVKKQIFARKNPFLNQFLEIKTNILPNDWKHAFYYAFHNAFVNADDDGVNLKYVKDMIQFLKNRETVEPFPLFDLNGHDTLWYIVKTYNINNSDLFEQLAKLLLEKGAPITQETIDIIPKRVLSDIRALLPIIRNILKDGTSYDWNNTKNTYRYNRMREAFVDLYPIAFYSGYTELAKKLLPLHKQANSFLKKTRNFFS